MAGSDSRASYIISYDHLGHLGVSSKFHSKILVADAKTVLSFLPCQDAARSAPQVAPALLRKAGVHEKDVPNYTRALAHCHCLLGE